jgi:hypothetical protein
MCKARHNLLMATKDLMNLFPQMQSCLLRILVCVEDAILIFIQNVAKAVCFPSHLLCKLLSTVCITAGSI